MERVMTVQDCRSSDNTPAKEPGEPEVQPRNWLRWVATVFLPKLLLFLLALPFVLLMRLIRPVLWVRFINISHRIGHAAGNIDTYLLERKLGIHGARVADIFYYLKPACNQQMIKMWSRVIPVFPDTGFLGWFLWANKKIPGGGVHIYRGRPNQMADIFLLSRNTPPPISFTPEEEARGLKLLQKMGVPAGKPYVCFFGRDNAYLQKSFPGRDYSYHNYRNGDIDNFVPAVRAMLDRGYYAIRMGSVVEKKFSLACTGVIDYSNTSWRDDFADLYLMSKCRFFFCQCGGFEAVARLFRKQVAFVSMAPMGLVLRWSPDFLFIFKKLWLKEEKRLMTFREILESGLGIALTTQEYQNRGVELVENSPDEILDLVIEKEERMQGRWQTNDEYEDLQRRFWSLYQCDYWQMLFKTQFNAPKLTVDEQVRFGTRIGSKFLMQNRDLLD